MRMRVVRRAAVAAVAVLAVALPLGSAALAADATGCAGSATSYAANGDVVDNVRAPGPGGTEDAPFRIDPEGSVAWQGGTTTVIQDGSWSVSVFGWPVMSGDFTNEDGKRKADGVQEMSSVPVLSAFLFTGSPKIPVSGDVSSADGSCTVSGWVTGVGSPVTSPMFWTGAGVLVLATLLLIWLILGTTGAPAVGAPAAESVAGTGVTT